MDIIIHKFGQVLTSRQSGKEALLAFAPTLANLKKEEKIILDFADLNTFSPSWGEEFIMPLHEKYGERLSVKQTENPSVALTLQTLEQIHGFKFKREE